MPAPLTNQCPVPGCRVRHSASMLMCRRHWFIVPPPLRQEVKAAYARFLKQSTYTAAISHAEACLAAVEAVAGAEGQPLKPDSFWHQRVAALKARQALQHAKRAEAQGQG